MSLPDEHRWSALSQEEPCIDGYECGYEKAKISLDLIEKMWDAYSDRPKLVFLNVLAGHVYANDWAKMYALAERYDDHLSSFLETMLSRKDADSTVIVLRADHGLQRYVICMYDLHSSIGNIDNPSRQSLPHNAY